MDIKKILSSAETTLNNNQRLIRWSWDYRERFGRYPDFKNYEIGQCRYCHRSVWTPVEDPTNPIDLTCSPECSERLAELRAERHWN